MEQSSVDRCGQSRDVWTLCTKILLEKTKPSISAQTPYTKCEICLRAKTWTKLSHQQDDDSKHSQTSTTEWLKKKMK